MKEHVSPGRTINEAAKGLQNQIKAPEWAPFVKTGTHKERPPQQKDWWHIRAASILRKVELLGPVGVNKLRTKYGGKKNRGAKPERFKKGSGNIIRKILQQLEQAQLLKQEKKNVHKGRILTAKGKQLLNESRTNAAKAAVAEKPKPAPVAPKAPEAPKPVPPKAPTPAPVAKAPEPVKEAPAVKAPEAPKPEAPKEQPKEAPQPEQPQKTE